MGLFSRLGEAYEKFIGGYSSDRIVDKSMSSGNSGVVTTDDLVSYINDQELRKSAKAPIAKNKSYLTDPTGQIAAMGYMDRPYSLTYDTLREMSTKNAVIAAIITTRVNQVSTFTRPARYDKGGIGYEITLRDPKATPNKKNEKEVLELESFLENTGYNRDTSRDSFDTFVRKITRDRLTYDQVNFEIVPDRVGRPAEFYAVDASTIRVANTTSKNPDGGTGNTDTIEQALGKPVKDIKYVQLINGTIKAAFTEDELAFGVANPRTDINIQPYGLAELEQLVKQITSHLWAEDYNMRYFSNGGTTKGILNLKGTSDAPISPTQLEAFKRQYVAQTLGNTGAWKTPVVSIPGMEYINVQQSNREMEFEKWMNYLINITAAVFQIDPAEVNFPNRGGAGNSGGGGLGNGGIEDRIQHSKDKGLRPLLRFIEDMINEYLISRFSDKYIFKFVGVNAKTENEIATLQEKQAKVYKTINEVRADNDLKPLQDGEIIEDPYFVQYRLNMNAQRIQQKQLSMQQQQMGQQSNNGVPNAPMTPIQGSSAGRVNNISPNSSQGTNENTGASNSDNTNTNVDYIDDESDLDKPNTNNSQQSQRTRKSIKSTPISKQRFIQIEVEDK